MNSSTKNILIFSLCTLILSAGACLFFAYEIFSKGARLQENITVVAERSAKEASYNRVRRLVQETEEERQAITSFFFQDESYIIDLLGEIEDIAVKAGLELSNGGLAKVTGPDEKTEYITITFTYSGQKDSVLSFSKILENLPFHSWASSLSLKKTTTSLWEGEQTIYITIQPS